MKELLCFRKTTKQSKILIKESINEIKRREERGGGAMVGEMSEGGEEDKGGDGVSVPMTGDMDAPNCSKTIQKIIKQNKIDQTTKTNCYG